MVKKETSAFIVIFLTIFLPVLCTYHSPCQAQESLTPKEILDKVDDLFRGQSSHGRMTMKITTIHWKRSLSLDFWSQGKDKSLIRILSPKKEKGTSTLRVGNDIWNYLPKVKKVIKLPSSMMSASWMGSHFTNDDLVKESRMADDYTFELTFIGERDGQEIMEITCHPKPDAAVVWGKVLVTVRPGDYLPLKILYFDEDLKPARTMLFSQIDTLRDRTLPTLMRVIPEHKPGEKTEILYENITFDLVLPKKTFSLRSLQK